MFTVRVLSPRTTLTRSLALLAAASFALVACGDSDPPGGGGAPADSSTPPAERHSATPRLSLSYDGGILVLDATTLEQVADLPVDGFVRLNSAGNGRHVLVSETGGFRVLDAGTWTKAHGDHGHHYTAELLSPRCASAEQNPVTSWSTTRASAYSATAPGRSTSSNRPNYCAATRSPPRSRFRNPTTGGVAVFRGDGSVVVTRGDDESRSGIAILDKERTEIARNDECPGVHGEAAASAGRLTFGCEDGILIVDGNNIHKVTSPDPTAASGTRPVTTDRRSCWGDYKSDRDAELERPTRFSLTDTRTGELRLVDLGTSYSFRSLERGPGGGLR